MLLGAFGLSNEYEDELAELVAAAKRLPPAELPSLLIPQGNYNSRGSNPRVGNESFSNWSQHVARYIVSDEYVPFLLGQDVDSWNAESWKAGLLAQCTQEELLRALTVATYVAGEGGVSLDNWTNHVLTSVHPQLARRLNSLLHPTDGGPGRVLLARQSLLQALKLVVADPPLTASTLTVADPFVVITLLSHCASRRATEQFELSGEKIARLPSLLAIDLVQNSLFNSAGDFRDLLARNWAMWTKIENRLSRYHPRTSLRQMLKEACGLELEDLLTCAFAVYSAAQNAGVGNPKSIDLSKIGLTESNIDVFLERFSATSEQLTDSFSNQNTWWGFLPVEEKPLLRIAQTTVAVIDLRLLERRFTSGIYWLVHDNEKSKYGEQARRKWTQTYSEIVEIYSEDIFRRLAPIVIGEGPAFFTEEQIGKLGGKAVDCGVDFGDFVMLVEIVQHQVTLPTRALGRLDSFEKDMQVAVHKKIIQLDGSVQSLLQEVENFAHPLKRRPQTILPVVLQGADFPLNPVTVEHAREKAKEAGLLTCAECESLVIITLDELEMVDAIVATQLTSAGRLFSRYAQSGAVDSFRNFMVGIYGGNALKRSSGVEADLNEVFTAIEDRLVSSA